MNKNINYILTSTIRNIYGQIITTYGIKGRNVHFDDISTDKTKVTDMINRMNKEELEESQFMYFIEDELI